MDTSRCIKEEERKLLAESFRVYEYAIEIRTVIENFVGEDRPEDPKKPTILNPIVQATCNIQDAQREITKAVAIFNAHVIRKVK
ncbi:hypothetical protein LCGC14_0572070 [marine sediment metagenome]|uniref:Uncharacterized protein n=1 Tax=marine sediment metagenome TaxID=412755 RepID=A0A0F9RNZ3_9ZZZZ